MLHAPNTARRAGAPDHADTLLSGANVLAATLTIQILAALQRMDTDAYFDLPADLAAGSADSVDPIRRTGAARREETLREAENTLR
ncbi:hypothetical protein [Streptomyces sp. NPDC058426]|uniref:hypothetical protein n=1 Tax=Streptomyces sp. NPDC058426 TaxID=3346493 RepID=UPI00364B0874